MARKQRRTSKHLMRRGRAWFNGEIKKQNAWNKNATVATHVAQTSSSRGKYKEWRMTEKHEPRQQWRKRDNGEQDRKQWIEGSPGKRERRKGGSVTQQNLLCFLETALFTVWSWLMGRGSHRTQTQTHITLRTTCMLLEITPTNSRLTAGSCHRQQPERLRGLSEPAPAVTLFVGWQNWGSTENTLLEIK